jgi:hypothetical protein
MPLSLSLPRISNLASPSMKPIPTYYTLEKVCFTPKDLIPFHTKNSPVTAGITAQEYAERRARLAASLPSNGIAILASADTKYRSGVVTYEFHQEPNFLYLTGFNEPQSVAVIQRHESSSDYTFHLFVRPKNAKEEQWDGAVSGEQAALDVFNADKVFALRGTCRHELIVI